MRVISGIYKSRIINQVNSPLTRETADKVRGAIFNSISMDVQGNILDLFAGSGAMGIEAISRGASFGYFVDNNPIAIKTIENNLTNLNIQNRKVFKIDYLAALKKLNEEKLTFKIIFLDPPYQMHLINDIIKYIIKSNLLCNNGLIVCEYHKDDIIDNNNLKIKKENIYGIKKITILRKEE